MELFGFSSRPFTNEMSIRHRQKMDYIEREIDALKRAISERHSGVLIAPSGAGKSVVLRALMDELPEARFATHYIKVTDLSTRDLCQEITIAMGAKPARNYASLVRSIQNQATSSLESDGQRVVIFVDEAHDMRLKAIKILKILTNFKVDSRRVVSIILAGGPGLKDLLYRAGMEEIRRRLVHCGELRLMSREETSKYIEHRVNIAGANRLPFDSSAIETLFELSRGNMGAIDLMALKALEIALIAGRKTLDSSDIIDARNHIWI
jgi:general secretion pathway protein A